MFSFFKFKKYSIQHIKNGEKLYFNDRIYQKQNNDEFILLKTGESLLEPIEVIKESDILSKYNKNKLFYFLENYEGIHYIGKFSFEEFKSIQEKKLNFFKEEESDDFHISANKFVFLKKANGNIKLEPLAQLL